MTTIDVRLRAEWIVGIGSRYDVLLDDELIVSRSRDPEHDAARVLHARGLRGRFRTIDYVTGKHRMTLDIEKAAKLSIVERDRGGLRGDGYRPLGLEARTVLHAPPVHQGRDIQQNVSPSTGATVEAAGGKGAERARRVGSDDGVARLGSPNANQGRPIGVEGVQGAGQPLAAAGGKTAVASRRVPEEV
jgi:hypothetical protein